MLKKRVGWGRMNEKRGWVVVEEGVEVKDGRWLVMNGGMGGMEFDEVMIGGVVSEE